MSQAKQYEARVTITPEIADEMLNKSMAAEEVARAAGKPMDRRPIRNSNVEMLSRALKAGRYDARTHQGIAISPEGLLNDGQHRLMAISESGVTVEGMLVTFNQPTSVRVVMDDGVKRNATDFTGLSTLQVGVVKLLVGSMSRRASIAEVALLAEKYRSAIDFATGGMTKGGKGHVRGVTVSTVFAVVARAWYSADKTRLRRFLEVLVSGKTSDSRDGAAITLREWLIKGRTLAHSQNDIRAQEQRKTTHALVAFLAGRDTKRVGELDINYFKIAE